MVADTPPSLVLDANVLIDYWHGNRILLSRISIHVAPICIPSPVLEEVEQLTPRLCKQLKIEVVEPSLTQLMAAAQQRGGLSLEDRLCLLLAKERRAACGTNDRRMRRECEVEGIPVLWGLEPLIQLVTDGHVTAKSARIVVERMRIANPRFITQKIVDDFSAKIDR